MELTVSVARQWMATRQEDELVQVVMYDRPRDFPDGVVLRAWYVSLSSSSPPEARLRKSADVCCFPSKDAARHFVDRYLPELAFIARDPNDDPCIAGMWT
jgi:hypothetical protein